MLWLVLIPPVMALTHWALAGKAEDEIRRHQRQQKG